MVWQSSSNPIFDGHHSFDWLSHPEISQKPLKSKTHCGFVKFSTQRLIKSTAIEDKSVCITNTEKQDTLTLFRQDRVFVLKNRIFLSVGNTHIFVYRPQHTTYFSPTEYCSLRKRWKEQPQKMWDCVCGDLGRPSRSSGPPHHTGQRTRRSILT